MIPDIPKYGEDIIKESRATLEFHILIEEFANNINALLTPLTATTAQLEDIAADINVSDRKLTGVSVYNTTTKIAVRADGSAAGSVWVDATGATAHTPI